MENFEKSFEDMDVRSEYVEQTMNSSTTAAMPEGEVDTLMQAALLTMAILSMRSAHSYRRVPACTPGLPAWRPHPTRPVTLRPPAS